MSRLSECFFLRASRSSRSRISFSVVFEKRSLNFVLLDLSASAWSKTWYRGVLTMMLAMVRERVCKILTCQSHHRSTRLDQIHLLRETHECEFSLLLR